MITTPLRLRKVINLRQSNRPDGRPAYSGRDGSMLLVLAFLSGPDSTPSRTLSGPQGPRRARDIQEGREISGVAGANEGVRVEIAAVMQGCRTRSNRRHRPLTNPD